MKFGIIGAMESEIRLVQKNMEGLTSKQVSGSTYYLGKIGESDVVLVCCGVGKVNAAIAAQTLCVKYEVDAIINTGISGALDSKLKVMDTVISRQVTYHDADLKVMQNFPPYNYLFEADPKLIELADQVLSNKEKYPQNHYIGKIVSGDVFVNDSALKKRIVEEFAPMCVEMEGAAIGHTATMNNTPFLILRTQSDSADDQADLSYEEFEVQAADISANIILDIIAGAKEL